MLNLTITFRSGKHETITGVTKIECIYDSLKAPFDIFGGMINIRSIKLDRNTFAIYKDSSDTPYGFYNGNAIEPLRMEKAPERN